MRKWKHAITTILLAALVITELPAVNAAAKGISDDGVILNDETGIPDPVLYWEILTALELDQDAILTKEDAESLTSLFASNTLGDGDPIKKGARIKSLKGIQYLKNLKYLSIRCYGLKNINGLDKLKKLTNLDLDWNQSINIKGIEKCKNLQYLSVYDCGIRNLTDMNKILKLKGLDIGHNPIKDLSILESMKKLESLSIDDSNLTKLPNLSKLKNLRELSLTHNKLKKLPDFSKLKYLGTSEELGAGDVNLTFNQFSGSELKKKLPKSCLKDKKWLNTQIRFQNVVRKITVTSPNSVRGISKNIKQITGKTHKYASVVLRDRNRREIAVGKANSKGVFTLKNLNLKKFAGKKLIIDTFLPHDYYEEYWDIGSLEFMVRN